MSLVTPAEFRFEFAWHGHLAGDFMGETPRPLGIFQQFLANIAFVLSRSLRATLMGID